VFTVAAICANPFRRQMLHQCAVEAGMLTVLGFTDDYPRPGQVLSQTHYGRPNLFLIDLEDPERALRGRDDVVREYSRTAVIGVGNATEQRRMPAGMFDGFLTVPFEPWAMGEAVRQVVRSRTADALNSLIAFIPAKAGSGATTATLCTATTLARDFHTRVLVLDTDLRSSVLEVMTGAAGGASTQAVLGATETLDELTWRGFVKRRFEVDLLLASSEVPSVLPDWYHYYSILAVAAPLYDAILVDLPELINRATEELVRRARRIFVVTTQEMTSLTLAKRRLAELEGWGIDPDRVNVLANRWHPKGLSRSELESILGYPVFTTVTNDYREIGRAIGDSAFPLQPRSVVAQDYSRFCQGLAEGAMRQNESGSFGFSGMLGKLKGRLAG
jgi:pilus assembly protein CpaE